MIVDKRQRKEEYSSTDSLENSGIHTRIDAQHAIAHHNKVMMIDGTVLIIGSFNFTKAAYENNAENLLKIHHDKKLAERYTKNWQECT
jgi:phosphatidylserine/phosphatidylglycerophosphate/cardiolipin synthase-like enzyme